MSPKREFAAVMVLFLLGFAGIALASAANSYLPLFFTPIPLALIPWVITRNGA